MGTCMVPEVIIIDPFRRQRPLHLSTEHAHKHEVQHAAAFVDVVVLTKLMVPGVDAVILVESNVMPSPIVRVFEFSDTLVANWLPNQRRE